jgi:hypothetical protein
MKLTLLKDVKGICKDSNSERLHAKAGDVLNVLLRNETYYVCDSKYYPNEDIIVFKSQIDTEISEPGGTIDEEILTLEPIYEELE